MFGSAYGHGTVQYASRGTENQDLSSNPAVRGLGQQRKSRRPQHVCHNYCVLPRIRF